MISWRIIQFFKIFARNAIVIGPYTQLILNLFHFNLIIFLVHIIEHIVSIFLDKDSFIVLFILSEGILNMLENCLQIEFLFISLGNQTKFFVHLHQRVDLSVFEKDCVLENKFTPFDSFVIGDQARNQPLKASLSWLNIWIDRVSFFQNKCHFLNRDTSLKVIFFFVFENMVFAELALATFEISTVANVHPFSLLRCFLLFFQVHYIFFKSHYSEFLSFGILLSLLLKEVLGWLYQGRLSNHFKWIILDKLILNF